MLGRAGTTACVNGNAGWRTDVVDCVDPGGSIGAMHNFVIRFILSLPNKVNTRASPLVHSHAVGGGHTVPGPGRGVNGGFIISVRGPALTRLCVLLVQSHGPARKKVRTQRSGGHLYQALWVSRRLPRAVVYLPTYLPTYLLFLLCICDTNYCIMATK